MNHLIIRRISLFVWLSITLTLLHAQEMKNTSFKIAYSKEGITSIVDTSDPHGASFIRGAWGNIILKYKVKDGYWQQNRKRTNPLSVKDATLVYSDTTTGNTLSVDKIFALNSDHLKYDIRIRNNSRFPVLIGDLAITIPYTTEGDNFFENAFTKHASISGDASFFYFTKFSGAAPYFVLTCDKGTPLEYYDQDEKGEYRAFIHSQKSGNKENRGLWRQTHTSRTLAPGEVATFGFTLRTAKTYQQIRDIVYQSLLIDTRIAPSLTLPRGQKAKFALRTKCPIDSVTAEHPHSTQIRYLGQPLKDTHLYEVSFDRLGEHQLTVCFDHGRKTYIEFFSSLPAEELLKKRASFLVNSQLHRDSTRWYNGLFGAYDMKNGVLRGPDNPDIYGEQLTYFLCSDDPILGKAPFLASKNVVFPNDEEIKALEYHIRHYIWGKLQRTDKETPYPYGVYGTPNWFVNRDTLLRRTQSDYKQDVCHVWRTYDYPHVFMLYYHMYQIAKLYPEKCTYATAEEYFERAFQTAKAYFVYPTELLGDYYEPFKWGCYNELLIVPMIAELQKKGRQKDAQVLIGEWEKKAKYFIYDDKYPYRSEYSADRTAFESSYALARYAIEHPMKNDKNLWYDKNEKKWYSHQQVTTEAARQFMERQHLANLACRGWLEPQWYLQGSDYMFASEHCTHSYMARMGGYSVLDYGLRYADEPAEWLQLGYHSYMNPFGVMNAGDEASDYGYWYSGKERDGALGQCFTPTKFASAWIGTQESRGPWRYCGEGDLGMCAITRTAATILTVDPALGVLAYGGNLSEEDSGSCQVRVADGVRTTFWVVGKEHRYGLQLHRDNISGTMPVEVSADFSTLTLTLDNGVSGKHSTELTVEAIDGKRPVLSWDGRQIPVSGRPQKGKYVYSLPVSRAQHTLSIRMQSL